MQKITLNINGHAHSVHVDQDTPLLYVLRNDLGLKAAKFACGLEQCGACKVIIDGQAVPSCHITARSVQGKEITTLEGLGTRENLHPLQQAFIDEQAIQCGFCVPGMIISAKALLDRNPNPTDGEIKSAMSDNLCRCGVYDRIRRAIKRAAQIAEEASSWKSALSNPSHATSGSTPVSHTDGMVGTLAFTPGIDAWVRINPDETVTVFTGKVELGQHIKTALAMIAAEELEVNLTRIRLVSGDTAQTPNEGYTAGSMSMEFSGNAIRNACAEAKQILLEKAVEKLNTEMENLMVKDGVITDTASGRSLTYGELFGGKRFEVNVMETGFLKAAEEFEIVGRPLYRDDLVAKVLGEPCFVQDLELKNMVHGRVVHPPNYGARLVSVDSGSVIQLPGVIKVVRDGSFLAVIAEREEQAIAAMNQLKASAEWKSGPNLPDQSSLMTSMKSQPHHSYWIKNGTTLEEPPPPMETPSNAAKTLSATYFRPFHMHAAIGPSAGVAQWVDGKMTVWAHNQGPFPLRAAIAQVLGMDGSDIRVIHMDGPGCYGHNGADDAAMDAALLARQVPGRPVSLKWTRKDEHAWEPYGPAMVVDIQSSLDVEGNLLDWNFDVWSCDHSGRPRPDREGGSGMLSAWHLEKPFKPLSKPRSKAPQLGSSRNAEPLYTFPNQRIVNHLLQETPLRVSSHRGLGSYANLFAMESFVDELAHAAGADPVEFRLRHLEDERAKAVIQAAAEKSGWEFWKKSKTPDRGMGMGFSMYKNRASYVAVV
ncbi:MAG: molybdopterin-dependent oxidoreductase, partial [Proteobacteria bacterium]|nr:molybdopterin-dependent oxidoreductase [Pseudomonadota bacterium]